MTRYFKHLLKQCRKERTFFNSAFHVKNNKINFYFSWSNLIFRFFVHIILPVKFSRKTLLIRKLSSITGLIYKTLFIWIDTISIICVFHIMHSWNFCKYSNVFRLTKCLKSCSFKKTFHSTHLNKITIAHLKVYFHCLNSMHKNSQNADLRLFKYGFKCYPNSPFPILLVIFNFINTYLIVFTNNCEILNHKLKKK